MTPIDQTVLAAADPEALQAKQPQQQPPAIPSAPPQLQQLSRLTFATAEAPLAATALAPNSAITATYDVLGVQPLSERVLTQVPSHPSCAHFWQEMLSTLLMQSEACTCVHCQLDSLTLFQTCCRRVC